MPNKDSDIHLVSISSNKIKNVFIWGILDFSFYSVVITSFSVASKAIIYPVSLHLDGKVEI